MKKIYTLLLLFVIILCQNACNLNNSHPNINTSNNTDGLNYVNDTFGQLTYSIPDTYTKRSCSVLWGMYNISKPSGGLTSGQNQSDDAIEYSQINLQISYIAYNAHLSISSAQELLNKTINSFSTSITDVDYFDICGCPAIKTSYINSNDYVYYRVLFLTNNHCYSIMSYKKVSQYDNDFTEIERFINSISICSEHVFQSNNQECKHDYIVTITQVATVNNTGIKQYQCKWCDYTYTEVIPQLEPEQTQTSESEESPVPDIQQVEILFRNIPFGSSSTIVKQQLKQNNDNIRIYLIKDSYILYPDTILSTKTNTGIVNGGNTIHAYNITAAGYDIKQAVLYFAYHVDATQIDRTNDKLYAATYSFDVVEYDYVYHDLCNKMTELYGNGEESTSVKSGWYISDDYTGKYEYQIRQTTWYGLNNTYATLEWVSSDNSADIVQYNCGVTLLYGSSNASKMLNNLEEALEKEKADSDRENSANDNTGL